MGYVPALLEHTERLVVLRKVQAWIDGGYSEREIFHMWNAGHPGKCSRGTNKYGAKYDSCAYVEKGLLALKK